MLPKVKTEIKLLIVIVALIAFRIWFAPEDPTTKKETPEALFAKTQEAIKQADVLVATHNWDAAEVIYKKALSAQKDPLSAQTGLLHRKIGMLYLEKGRKSAKKSDFIQAETSIEKALSIHKTIDDKAQMIHDYAQLALIASAEGSAIKFKNHLSAQLPLYKALGQEPLSFTVYVPLAALYKAQGDAKTACSLLLAAHGELMKPEAEILAKPYSIDTLSELKDVKRRLGELSCAA